MSNEIQRVYQFLSQQGDWVSKADKNGDGNITKNEFRNFMEEDFEWNGEDKSAKDDLINQFWAKVDTNRARSYVSGSKTVMNINALDSKELSALESRIEMQEILDDYTSGLSCPNVVSNSAKNWKEDVVAELQTLLENYIAEGGAKENLATYLETNAQFVENKVTAEYCAAEYLNEVMPELNKEYGYAFGSDKSLDNIINNYVQNLPEGITPEEMKSTLTEIIDAYLATAGLKEANGIDLSAYGYEVDENTPLNDLQKSVAEAKLTEYIAQSSDAVFDNLFSGLTLSSDAAKANFKESLNTALKDAKTNFVESLKYNDFQNLDAKLKEFDIAAHVTDNMKTEVYKEYLSDIADNLVNQLADRLAEGVSPSGSIFGKRDSKSDRAIFGFSLYNPEIGRFSLDNDTISELMSDLNKNIATFINNFVSSGADMSTFETKLKLFLEEYLMGGNSNAAAVESARETVTADPYISNSELPAYKETCISVVKNLLGSVSGLKLGSTALTTANYQEVINAYTDGKTLMDDMKKMLDSINTENKEGKLATAVKEAREAAAKEEKENVQNSAPVIAEVIDDIVSKKLSTIINGHASMHTEFGMDARGNIIFQNAEATEAFNSIIRETENMLNSNEKTKKALEEIGGSDVLKKLVQAAWIATYNNFNSSISNNTTAFVQEVFNNLKDILNKLAANPEYLEAYTAHTAYADTSLTDGLIHYNTKTTSGNDELIIYKGGVTQASDGTVHLANTGDDPDYQATMSQLLTRLKDKYSYIDATLVENTFRQAQIKAMDVLVHNTNDCPYGTGNNSGRVEDQTKNWGGKDNRKDDNHKIHMDQVVQITLYFFDKLFYQALANS